MHIMLNSRVLRILIDPLTKVAHGVEMFRKGRRMIVKARKEVILSAGSFHSPQLLMLSGIGPKYELQKVGVPLIEDLPVGREMYDHISFPGMLFITNLTNPSSDFFSVKNVIKFAAEYAIGQGFLTIANGVEALGFIKTPTSNSPHPRLADVELILLLLTPQVDGGNAAIDGERLQRSVYNTVFKPWELYPTYTFLIVLSLFHPKSVGFLELKDRNPFNSPRFFANFLKEPEDVETLLEAVKV